MLKYKILVTCFYIRFNLQISLEKYMAFYTQQDGSNQVNSMDNSTLQQPNQTLTKISNFLEMKKISINEFWQSNRNYASLQDIEKFCDYCGLKLGVYDQINLKNCLFTKREVISIYEFCEFIPQWKNEGDVVGQFLRQRSDQLVNTLNNKIKTQRIKSAGGTQSLNLTNNTFYAKRNNQVSSYIPSKPFRQNNSAKYLKQNKIRSLQKEQQLLDTIQKTKNQQQYTMLMKMNELNQYHHKNKSTKTYRGYKNAEGIIKIRVYQLEIFKKELTTQQFESEYKIYKKMTKENKQWERPKSVKILSGGVQDLISKVFQDSKQMTAVTKNQKKEQRQQELRNLLVNTVNLTKLLEQQIRVFKMKGIHGCDKL